MNRRFHRCWLSLPALLSAALLTLQAQQVTPPTQEVTLQYAPADGQQFEVVETVTRIADLGGPGPTHEVRQRDSLVEVAAVSAPDANTENQGMTVDPVPESTAFSNRVTILSQSLTRNDEEIVSPMYAALSGLALTYHLNVKGQLLEIAGYEGLGAAMAERLPDKLASTLSKLVNQSTLRHQDRASYEEVYGPYAEGSVTPVVNAVSAVSHALPQEAGSVPLYAVSTIERTPDGKINVRRWFDSDSERLAAQIDGLDEAAILAVRGELEAEFPATYRDVSVSGHEEVDVQVAGALVERRILALTTTWSIVESEGATPITRRVEVTREFEATPVPVSDEATTETQPETQP